MERFALLVDAGYFFAAGSEAAFGTPTPRRDIRLMDPGQVILDLKRHAQGLCGDIDLLRVYWYDAMPGPSLSLEQSELSILPGLKLRLGVLNSYGQQKGVDSLVVTDLIDLARNRAVVDTVLISGDEDVRVGVQIAQSYGLKVHLLGAGDTAHNVSRALQMEADSFSRIDDDWFAKSFEMIPEAIFDEDGNSESRLVLEPVEGEAFDDAAVRVARSILSALDVRGIQQLNVRFQTDQMVPLEYDRRLIGATANALGGVRFSTAEMRVIRGVFVRVVREMAEASSDTGLEGDSN